MKLILVLACVGLSALLGEATAGRLLRVPRVYNALITTNEKVLSSRAYPFSAPLLHPIEYQPLTYFPINPYIGAVPLQLHDTDGSALPEEKSTGRAAEEPKEEEKDSPKEEAVEVEEAPKDAPEDAAPKLGNALPYLTPISTPFTSQLGLSLPFYSPFNYYPTLLPYSYPLGLPSALTYSVPAIGTPVQYSLPLPESVMNNKPKDAAAPDVPPAAPSGSTTDEEAAN